MALKLQCSHEGPGSERKAKTLLFPGKGGSEPENLGPDPPITSSVTLGKLFALSEPRKASFSSSGQWRQHLLYGVAGRITA